MEALDIGAVVKSMPGMAMTPKSTTKESAAAFRMVAKLNDCPVFVVKFSGEPPWERHPTGDELLYVLEGEIEIIILTGDGMKSHAVQAGSAFVVPKNVWHRQVPRPSVTLLSATPRTETSSEIPSLSG